MLYNSCTGIYKFGNNTYPRRIRRRSNLGHIFREKSASYGPGNTVIIIALPRQHWLRERATVLKFYVHYECCFDVGTKYVHTLLRQKVRFLSGKLCAI
jgi:hypothetical protein